MRLSATMIAVVALTFTGFSAEAAKKRVTSAASDARAECIKEAMAKVNAMPPQATIAEKNSDGLSAYRDCAATKGIRP